MTSPAMDASRSEPQLPRVAAALLELMKDVPSAAGGSHVARDTSRLVLDLVMAQALQTESGKPEAPRDGPREGDSARQLLHP